MSQGRKEKDKFLRLGVFAFSPIFCAIEDESKQRERNLVTEGKEVDILGEISCKYAVCIRG